MSDLTKEPPYFPIYVNDTLGAVAHLDVRERGVYLTTFLLFHRFDCALPLSAVASACSMDQMEVANIIDRFPEFDITDDFYVVSSRIERHHRETKESHARAVERGRKGAEKRWGKERKDA